MVAPARRGIFKRLVRLAILAFVCHQLFIFLKDIGVIVIDEPYPAYNPRSDFQFSNQGVNQLKNEKEAHAKSSEAGKAFEQMVGPLGEHPTFDKNEYITTWRGRFHKDDPKLHEAPVDPFEEDLKAGKESKWIKSPSGKMVLNPNHPENQGKLSILMVPDEDFGNFSESWSAGVAWDQNAFDKKLISFTAAGSDKYHSGLTTREDFMKKFGGKVNADRYKEDAWMEHFKQRKAEREEHFDDLRNKIQEAKAALRTSSLNRDFSLNTATDDDVRTHHGPNWEAHQAKKAAREAAKTARLGLVAPNRIDQNDPFAAIDNSALRDTGL